MKFSSLSVSRESKIEFDVLKARKQVSADEMLKILIEHYKNTIEKDIN